MAASGLWRAAALRLSWKVDAIRPSSFLHAVISEEVWSFPQIWTMNTVVILVQSLFSSQSLPQYWKTVRRKDFSSASKAEKLHDSRHKLQILTARHWGSTLNQLPAAPPEYRFATFLDEELCLSETGTSRETPWEGRAPGSPRGLSGKCVHA